MNSSQKSPDFFGLLKVQFWVFLSLSKVHAYDPTVSFPPLRGNSISYQKLGVAAERSIHISSIQLYDYRKFNTTGSEKDTIGQKHA